MELVVTLVSIDIIASKFLEAYISSRRLDSFDQRTNTLIYKLKEKLGLQEDVWLNFFLTVLGVAVAVWMIETFYTATAYQLLFIFAGVILITLNLGSAHSIYYGRQNFITQKVRK